jgi:hypothetical protein
MTASKGATRFFRGFATATMGLGVLLGVLWLALWGIEAAGGPDWRMPMRLLQSAATDKARIVSEANAAAAAASAKVVTVDDAAKVLALPIKPEVKP